MSGSEVGYALVPARWAAAIVLATVLGACSADDRREPPDQNGTSFTAVDEPVLDRGLVWADGSEIRLGDGTVLDAGEEITAFVVGGVGAYGVAPGSRELLEIAPDGVRETGATVDPETLRISPDGRYLAFLDPTVSEEGGDAPLAEAVVVDLAEGEEIGRTTDGMPDEDVLEESSGPSVFGLTDEGAYVDTVTGYLRVDLASGETEVTEGSAAQEDWYAQIAGEAALTSPDGSATIVPAFGGEATRVERDDGRTVTLTYEQGKEITVNSWLDDRTAVGITGSAQDVVLLTCPLPEGVCEPVPDTEDGVLLPVDRQGYDKSVVRITG